MSQDAPAPQRRDKLTRMPTIENRALPPQSLLRRYAASGAYTDCYTTAIARPLALPAYVEAFYRGAAIRLERQLIGWLMGWPSTDEDVRRLAHGEAERFSAWRVEDRRDDQLLLSDVSGRTRSWLMCRPDDGGTRLFFGSAVVPRTDPTTGEPAMGRLFKPMLGFHRLYSRLLLSAARARLRRG